MKRNVATRNAVAVDRLLAAGANVFGKTNVPVMLADWQTLQSALRHDRLNGDINAVCAFDIETARKRARAADKAVAKGAAVPQEATVARRWPFSWA